MPRTATLALLTIALASAVAILRGQTAAPMPGFETLERLDQLPRLTTDTEAHYLSSFDRTGGNDDGFRGTYSALYVDERGEHVIFDAVGPGAVYTLWFTSRENGWAALGWGRIRFYFDDETTPRLDLDADELFSGRHAPFVAPFVFDRYASTGGYVSYVPLLFARRLKITTEHRVGFYNVYYQTFAPDRAVTSWTGREDGTRAAAVWNSPGRDPKPAGDAEVFKGSVSLAAPLTPDGEMKPIVEQVGEWTGTGAITALTLRPLFPLTAYQLNHVRLRLSWDGEATPSVDVPLGSFFGSGLGEASVRAVPLGMSPSGAYYCYLPMPFWSRARLALVNDNPGPVPAIAWEVHIARGAVPYAATDSGYFKAQYRREWPTTAGRDFQILDTTGRGVYVGQVMTVEPLRAEVKRWWEGDLRIHVDGRRSPAFHGTGHEDEYLGGWSNEWLMNPYSLPMHGEPASRDLTQVDFQWNAATTVYRFFPGGVPYQSRLTVSTEHGVDNGVPAMYSSVAYYYERDGAMTVADTLDVGDAADEQRHGYRATPAATATRLESSFEGAEATPLADDVRTVSERSRFTVRAPANARALRLRRRFDQSAVQEAEVWVNGARIGVWYSPATNTTRRWAEADFLLPSSLAGRPTLDVELRVVRGTWSEARYELWAR
jgi:hypothetical protein